MEEMVYKFIDKGKREHEDMRAFISEFKTTNEILFKERNNSLSELRFEVYGLSKVIDNALISNYEAKGVTTRGGKIKTQDLGASISLIPYTMYEKLGLGEPKPIRMSLELVDRSIQYPRGRPFLVTAQTMIDVFNKKITLRVGNDEVIFDLDQSIKRPPAEDDECYVIDDLDDTINIETHELLGRNESDKNSNIGMPIKRIDPINTPYSKTHKTTGTHGFISEHLYSASANEIDIKKHELKDLPHHLEYTYLHGFFQILIAPKDQEKTMFTYPYGTFAYRRMPFGLCNAPATFQRCMTTIFHEIVEEFMEVFMDNVSVFALYGFSPCQWCTCERYGIDLRDGICPLCNSINSCAYDPNPNSFDCPPDSYHPPHPTYETYSGDSGGNDSQSGYDCPPQFPLNYELEPGYTQNYNSCPHDSLSFSQ
nr:hypothetical protein [Tanacetum cinerariifolium]